MGPLCSIVVPTYNGKDLLKTCLDSVFRHLPTNPELTAEVIVVDDGSTDGTPGWLAAITRAFGWFDSNKTAVSAPRPTPV